jgi:hypothetical protein
MFEEAQVFVKLMNKTPVSRIVRTTNAYTTLFHMYLICDLRTCCNMLYESLVTNHKFSHPLICYIITQDIEDVTSTSYIGN